MKQLILILALLPTLVSVPAASAQQNCVCTAGCTLVSDPYLVANGVPTSCNVYKGGVLYASGPAVLSSTIPLSNALSCAPPSAAYNPNIAGSVACAVPMPALAAGSYVLTMTAVNAAGESGQSGNITIQSVAVLPTVLPAPTNLRIR